MMKKTVGVLAALTLTLSSVSGIAAGAEGLGEDEGVLDLGENPVEVQAEKAAAAPQNEIEAAIGSGDTAAERTAVEEFALDTCDPAYFKAMQAQAEFEANAGGGEENETESGTAETEIDPDEPAEIERALASSRSYISYTGTYITHNSRFDSSTKTIGIDVSQWQYSIDWNKVKAAGIDYAIIRVGYRGWGSTGDLVTDPYFSYNIKNAKAAGLKIGVYFYTQAISQSEAKAEARYVLNALGGTALDLPVYYDIEAVGNGEARLDVSGLSKASKTKLCSAFCDEIKAGGYEAGVYSYRNYFYNDIDGPGLGEKYPVWLADYSSESPYTGSYHMWQFASTARVSGISNNCDINVYYGKYNVSQGKGLQSGTTAVDTPEVPASLSKPTGLHYEMEAGLGTVTLTWDSVDKAAGYEVSYYDNNTGKYTSVTKVTDNSCTLESPDLTKEYYIRAYVAGSGSTVYSPYSAGEYLTDEVIKSLTAKKSGSSVVLTWEEDDSDGYTIYRSTNGSDYTKIGESEEGKYTDSSVPTSSLVYYYVEGYYDNSDDPDSRTKGAKSAAVSISGSPSVSSSKPAAPKLAAFSANSATLTWDEVENADGYQVLLYNPSTGKYTLKADISVNSDRRFTIDKLTSGTAYRAAVRAYSGTGEDVKYGLISDNLSFTTMPGEVLGLKATPTSSGATLSWKAQTGAEYYNVYKKTSDGYSKLGSTKKTTVSIQISGSSKKEYCVTAVMTINGKTYESNYCTPVSVVTTVPGTPSFTSASYANGSLTLTWKKTVNTSGYRLYRYDPSTKKYKSVKTFNVETKTSYTLKNISSNSTLKFKVKAYRRDNGIVQWGTASKVFTVKTGTSLAAPSNVYTTAQPSSINIKWDAVGGASSYNVYEIKGSTYTLLGETKKTSVTLKSSPGSGRKFAISTNSVSGSSKLSGAYSKTTEIKPVPGSADFTASEPTASSIKLTWKLPEGASGVRLYRYNSSTRKYVTVKTLSSKKTSYTVKNLASGYAYRFKIKPYVKTSTGITWGSTSLPYNARTN